MNKYSIFLISIIPFFDFLKYLWGMLLKSDIVHGSVFSFCSSSFARRIFLLQKRNTIAVILIKHLFAGAIQTGV